MADLVGLLRSGNNDQVFSALQSILRSAYTTGRSSRALLRAVLQVAASGDAPISHRTLAYEVLWTIVAPSDANAYKALVALARNDMTSSDHPDLALTALATLSSLPPPYALEVLLSGEDTDRTFADAITGDAPPFVRTASIMAFSSIALHAWMQAGADYTALRAGSSWPLDSLHAIQKRRQQAFERCCEVFKAVCKAAEDGDAEVAGAAVVALRLAFEDQPLPLAVPAGANAAGRGPGFFMLAPAFSQYLQRDATLGLAASLPAGSASSSAAQLDAGNEAAMLTAQRLRSQLLQELSKRLVPRLPYLMVRLSALQYQARASAVRLITLLLAGLLLGEGGGKGGPIAGPVTVRLDSSSGQDVPVHQLLSRWVNSYLLPILQRPFSPAGPGAGALAAGLGGGSSTFIPGFKGTAASPYAAASAAASAAVLQLEAARAVVQLAATFAAGRSQLQARIAAGQAAVADLEEAVPACQQAGSMVAADSAEAVASLLHTGVLPVDTTASLASQQRQAWGSYTALCGPLVDAAAAMAGGGAAVSLAAYSLSAALLLPHLTAALPAALSALLRLLRCITSGANPLSAGTVVATAGWDAAGAVGFTVPAVAGVGAGAGSLTGGAAGASAASAAASSAADFPSFLSSGSPLGLGSGSSSSLQSEHLLIGAVSLAMGAASLLRTPLFLSSLPAILREVGRLGDALGEDSAAAIGSSSVGGQNFRRVSLLLRGFSMAVHAVSVEAAPRGALVAFSVPAGAGAGAGAGVGGETAAAAVPLPGQELGLSGNETAGVPQLLLSAASAGPALARIAFEATRPLPLPNGSNGNMMAAGAGSGAAGAAINATRAAGPNSAVGAAGTATVMQGSGSGLGGHGDAHAAEVAQCTLRFRAEVQAAMLQALTRAAPSSTLLQRAVDVSTGWGDVRAGQLQIAAAVAAPTTIDAAEQSSSLHADAAEAQAAAEAAAAPRIEQLASSSRSSRLHDAETLHLWLCRAMDSLAASFWLLPLCLSLGGTAGLARDRAAAVLARVMGTPDLPVYAATQPAFQQPCSLYGPKAAVAICYPHGPAAAATAGGSVSSSSRGLGSSSSSLLPSQSQGQPLPPFCSSYGSSGIGVTGWVWARDFESVSEACECFLNLLTTAAALLFPSPLPDSYEPVGYVSGGASLQSCLALDLLPPAVLLLHRSRLQSLLSALASPSSHLDLGIHKLYEVERAAQALAPRLAASIVSSAAANGSVGFSASSSRPLVQFDALPSALPLQLRCLWLLCACWDGSTGGTDAALQFQALDGSKGGAMQALQAAVLKSPAAYFGALATRALHSHHALVPSYLQEELTEAVAGAAANLQQVWREHERQLGGGNGSGSKGAATEAAGMGPAGSRLKAIAASLSSLSIESTAAIAAEALRQKRLSTLAKLLLGEAGTALGVGSDIEAAGQRALTLIRAMQSGSSVQIREALAAIQMAAAASRASAAAAFTAGGTGSGAAGGVVGAAGAADRAGSTAVGGRGGAAASAAAGSSSSSTAVASEWLRGSKLGKALGFFGSLRNTLQQGAGGGKDSSEGAAAAAMASSLIQNMTGEGTVVTHAHFWLLLDMLAQLAASQRCTAGLVARGVESMLVQPRLSPEVGAALQALLPRLALFAAAYGRSSLARHLHLLDAENARTEAETERRQLQASGGAATGNGAGAGAAPGSASKTARSGSIAIPSLKLSQFGAKLVGAGEGSAAGAAGSGASSDAFASGAGAAPADGGVSLSSARSSSAPLLHNAEKSGEILTAVAAEATRCLQEPWALQLFDPSLTVQQDGSLTDAREEPVTAAMLRQLEGLKALHGAVSAWSATAAAGRAADALVAAGPARSRTGTLDSTAPPSVPLHHPFTGESAELLKEITLHSSSFSGNRGRGMTAAAAGAASSRALEVLADLVSPPAAALIAAAAAPELAQNSSLGLNRSTASSARMRTAVPLSTVHCLDAVHAAASMALLARDVKERAMLAAEARLFPLYAAGSAAAGSAGSEIERRSRGASFAAGEGKGAAAVASAGGDSLALVPAAVAQLEREREQARQRKRQQVLLPVLPCGYAGSVPLALLLSDAESEAADRLLLKLSGLASQPIASLSDSSKRREAAALATLLRLNAGSSASAALPEQLGNAQGLAGHSPLALLANCSVSAADSSPLSSALPLLMDGSAAAVAAAGAAIGAGAGESKQEAGAAGGGAASSSIVQHSTALHMLLPGHNQASSGSESKTASDASGVPGANLAGALLALSSPSPAWLPASLDSSSSRSTPMIVSSSSDPFTIALSHSLMPAINRLVLHLDFTNDTRVRLPAGSLQLSLQLSGALLFDRSAVTAAVIVNSGHRLGNGSSSVAGIARVPQGSSAAAMAAAGGPATGGGSGGLGGGSASSAGAGGAAAGAGSGTLLGDFLFLQRSGLYHATHTLRHSLPAGATLSYSVVLSVNGFGGGGVRVTTQLSCVDGEKDEEEQEGGAASLPPEVQLAARVGASIGSSRLEDLAGSLLEEGGDVDEDDPSSSASSLISALTAGGSGGPSQEELAALLAAEREDRWGKAGTGVGGCLGDWATDLLASDPRLQELLELSEKQKSAAARTGSDALIWSGGDLRSAKKGRLLSNLSLASKQLELIRASALSGNWEAASAAAMAGEGGSNSSAATAAAVGKSSGGFFSPGKSSRASSFFGRGSSSGSGSLPTSGSPFGSSRGASISSASSAAGDSGMVRGWSSRASSSVGIPRGSSASAASLASIVAASGGAASQGSSSSAAAAVSKLALQGGGSRAILRALSFSSSSGSSIGAAGGGAAGDSSTVLGGRSQTTGGASGAAGNDGTGASTAGDRSERGGGGEDTASDGGGSAGGGSHAEDDDAATAEEEAAAAAAASAAEGADAAAGGAGGSDGMRSYRLRKLEFTSALYRIHSWQEFLRPQPLKLAPALALAISAGADVLPGAASCFGAVQGPALLAAAAIQGGGVPFGSAAAAAAGLEANSSLFAAFQQASASGSGSVVSITTLPFAGAIARLPYAHYGLALSQPFLPGALAEPVINAAAGGGMPMGSPAWLLSLFSGSLAGSWAPIPLPLCPPLNQPAAGQAGILDMAQFAFSSSTWGGAPVILFATAFLAKMRVNNHAEQGRKEGTEEAEAEAEDVSRRRRSRQELAASVEADAVGLVRRGSTASGSGSAASSRRSSRAEEADASSSSASGRRSRSGTGAGAADRFGQHLAPTVEETGFSEEEEEEEVEGEEGAVVEEEVEQVEGDNDGGPTATTASPGPASSPAPRSGGPSPAAPSPDAAAAGAAAPRTPPTAPTSAGRRGTNAAPGAAAAAAAAAAAVVSLGSIFSAKSFQRRASAVRAAFAIQPKGMRSAAGGGRAGAGAGAGGAAGASNDPFRSKRSGSVFASLVSNVVRPNKSSRGEGEMAAGIEEEGSDYASDSSSGTLGSFSQGGAAAAAGRRSSSSRQGKQRQSAAARAAALAAAERQDLLSESLHSIAAAEQRASSDSLVWQVSFQVRCADARVRAAFAAEFSTFLHSVSKGRLSLLSHGHAPPSSSLLASLDVLVGRSLSSCLPEGLVSDSGSGLMGMLVDSHRAFSKMAGLGPYAPALSLAANQAAAGKVAGGAADKAGAGAAGGAAGKGSNKAGNAAAAAFAKLNPLSLFKAAAAQAAVMATPSKAQGNRGGSVVPSSAEAAHGLASASRSRSSSAAVDAGGALGASAAEEGAGPQDVGIAGAVGLGASFSAVSEAAAAAAEEEGYAEAADRLAAAGAGNATRGALAAAGGVGLPAPLLQNTLAALASSWQLQRASLSLSQTASAVAAGSLPFPAAASASLTSSSSSVFSTLPAVDAAGVLDRLPPVLLASLEQAGALDEEQAGGGGAASMYSFHSHSAAEQLQAASNSAEALFVRALLAAERGLEARQAAAEKARQAAAVAAAQAAGSRATLAFAGGSAAGVGAGAVGTRAGMASRAGSVVAAPAGFGFPAAVPAPAPAPAAADPWESIFG